MAQHASQIKEFEDELKTTKYNKRTQHHIGLVKAKIAKLRERDERDASKKQAGTGYNVRKSGDATVVMLGFPSVGKSTLLNALTDAESPVGDYDFTTLSVIPGLLEYNSAKIQILDVPGVVRGAASGRGRGKEVLNVMRTADLVLMVIEANHPEHYEVLRKEVFDSNIRLDQRKPDVILRKTARGGISISRTIVTELSDETIKAVMSEFKLTNADVVIRENINIDQLIDIIEKSRIYLPSLAVLNKVDLINKDRVEQIQKQFSCIPISGKNKANLEKVKELLFKKLRFIRIFLKEVGKKPDMDIPMIMREGDTIRDVCDKIHRDFIERFKFARVWGSSKFPGQKLSLQYTIKDRDVVEIHLK